MHRSARVPKTETVLAAIDIGVIAGTINRGLNLLNRAKIPTGHLPHSFIVITAAALYFRNVISTATIDYETLAHGTLSVVNDSTITMRISPADGTTRTIGGLWTPDGGRLNAAAVAELLEIVQTAIRTTHPHPQPGTPGSDGM